MNLKFYFTQVFSPFFITTLKSGLHSNYILVQNSNCFLHHPMPFVHVSINPQVTSLSRTSIFKQNNQPRKQITLWRISNQIRSTSRQTVFNIHSFGNNILSNKFFCITNKIKLDLFNLPYHTYKYKMKNLFLPFDCVN
jgi:hypothetical protein